MKKLIFAFAILTIGVSTSCKKKKTTTPDSSVHVNTYNTSVTLAYDASQTDPMCFLDLDNGAVYSVSQASAHQSEIDVVYVMRYMNANDPMFISIGNFDGGSGYPISYWDKTTLGINTWTTFNHTYLSAVSSSSTTAMFDAMQTTADLTTWYGSAPIFDNLNVNPNSIGALFKFKTHQNKRGAIKVIDCVNGSNGYATIQIKVEP